ncbi:MAG: nitrate reductase cytochrome c-type subunit [Nitrospirae bacterium]|nr:nitrate reductase cytochrome c-type subunit [Nitrospirota bacterium]MCL5062258.1 nitrate reductase cytochrome c-type subunit [Nitrospirota bacterium]MDA8339840.1 nitrate reductase cytochrome c-type subunit [Nitrospiraceae bacterium]
MSAKKSILVGAVIAIVMAITAEGVIAQTKTLTDEELGIRKETIYDEGTVKPEHGEYSRETPGKSKRIERSFENSPPLIPHDITGMLPIAETNNICLGCHMPDAARSMGAVPIPKSHFMDFETKKDLKGKLDGKRYNCVQCHVPQTETAPPVKNVFKGEFREKKGKFRSNLIDTLNEGVTAE